MTASTLTPPDAPARAAAARAGALWWVTLLFALPIVGYALAYVALGERMYPPNLLESFRARPWGIYPHALFGSVALLTGTLQFNRRLLVRRRPLHRTLGKVYVVSCLVVGGAGLYMSFHAIEGPVTRYGFGALALATLGTTLQAYRAIRAGRIAVHREWMIRSLALIFAAVTLRIELPLLIAWFQGDFAPAYRVVAWLCWVPNLLWAEVAIRVTRRGGQALVQSLRTPA